VFEIKSTYREGPTQYYEIRIHDPTSSKLLVLTGLDDDAKEVVMKTVGAKQDS
jgi:hypothetical protein